jgi:hypothetical protein
MIKDSKKHKTFGESLSGLPFRTVFLRTSCPTGNNIPLGRTELPAKSISAHVDGIIEENMHNLLTDDRKNLKQIIGKEIRGEEAASTQ